MIFLSGLILLELLTVRLTLHKVLQIIRDADVMIYGAAPLIYLRERISTGKLTFMYSERWLKKGLLNLFSPRLF